MPILVPSVAVLGLDVVAGDVIDVTSRSGGAYTQGRWISAAPTTVSGVAATVQPANGRDLLRLPENRRTSEAVRIITRQPLSAGDEQAGREADRVTYLGLEYEVGHVASWSGVFVDAVAVLLGQ